LCPSFPIATIGYTTTLTVCNYLVAISGYLGIPNIHEACYARFDAYGNSKWTYLFHFIKLNIICNLYLLKAINRLDFGNKGPI